MISRRTALKSGDLYELVFTYKKRTNYNSLRHCIKKGEFYDFLFENDYQAWFCNSVSSLHERSREVKEHIARLHTGETLISATPNWNTEEREKLGQQYLKDLIRDILDYFYQIEDKYVRNKYEQTTNELIRLLELDGYQYKTGILLIPEADSFDIDTEKSYLHELIEDTQIGNVDVIKHHLDLSEEHYTNSKWDDSIGNSRKFFEEIVRQTAIRHYFDQNQKELDNKISNKAGSCISYLKKEGLLEEKEDKALGELYVLMSDTGGHPYMAKKDQARLLRNLSLTIAQFVLLRFQGYQNA